LRLPFLILTLLSLITGLRNQPEQSGVAVVPAEPQVIFGESIEFSAVIEGAQAVQAATLFIQPAGQATRTVPIQGIQDGQIDVIFNLSESPLRPFADIAYWYQLDLPDGQRFISPQWTFFYEDNRFDWQRLDQDDFQVAWVDGDIHFGQEIINTARNALTSANSLIPVNAPSPLRIYVYASSQDLQSAMQVTNTPWAAGHASPDLGVILITVQPGPDEQADMERLLPHEMTHILQYQYVGEAYSKVPTWLLEGMATDAELYPNQEYQQSLDKAESSNSLLSMANLCGPFPRDLSGAILAYAQSASFVHYLYQNYGGSGLLSLLDEYKDGLGCEEGFRAAFNQSLSQAEFQWQQNSLGQDVNRLALQNLAPYLLIALLILIPVVISLLTAARRKPPQEGNDNAYQ
jgi:hypothetical protein